jgi:hypothetical protein
MSAPASWSAATESSQSPLLRHNGRGVASFVVVRATRPKAVTPSPQSKTWRQFDDLSRRSRCLRGLGSGSFALNSSH